MENYANFNVLFITRTSTKKQLRKEYLYARITVGNKRSELSLGKIVSAGLFNTKAQRCLGKTKEATQVNEFLFIVNSNVNEIRKQLILEQKEITPELIKARYKGEEDPGDERPPMLLEMYDEHNRKFKELIGTTNHSAATYERHLTSRSHTSECIKNVYGVNDLPFEKVNYKFLTDYEHYFKTRRKCNHNSTMKYIKNLGKIINQAEYEGYLKKNPFNKFKVSYEFVERETLTQKEIDTMIELEIPEQRLDRVRDMFVFCMHTGIAFGDMQQLTMDHIYEDEDGTKWIKNKRLKSNVEFMVPVLPVAQKIIDKYANTPLREKSNKVIPSISNQNYNGYLKEVAIRCKINKNLTSHIARHTFATTVSLENGVRLEVISKMLGHRNIKTTQIYAKLHEKAIKRDMQGLFDNQKKNSKKKKRKVSVNN
ncbi:MAG: site-specific integrase [Bacteroidales bacterium]|nr:site-specific integrase [Bacteroidales bacterium]